MNWFTRHYYRFKRAFKYFYNSRGLGATYYTGPMPGTEVLDLISQVIPLTRVALVGGAVRDAVHYRPAKDLDIAFWNVDLTEFHALRQFLFENGYRPQPIPQGEEGPHDGEEGERLHGFARYQQPNGGLTVDLLCFAPRYRSLEDVINSFDYSINQYAYAHSKALGHYVTYGPGYYVVRSNEFPVGECRRIRATVTPEREARVKEVAQQLRWTYIDDERDYA